MKRNITRSLLLALVGVCTLNLHAAPTWTTGEGVPNDWSPLAGNLLLNKTGKLTGSSSYLTKDITKITDGVVPSSRKYTEMFGFAKDATVEWDFGAPMTLEKVRITTCDITDGRQFDNITIADVLVKSSGSDAWISLGCGSVEWKGSDGQGIMLYVSLEDSMSGHIAEGVTGLRIKFGPHSTVAQYYSEIEAVGYAEATPPVLGAINIVPAKTKAVFAGTITDVGTDATACEVHLSLNGGPAVKIAEDVTGAFEYEIPDLTPDTTYRYELIVYNDAQRTTTKNGEFKTLDAEAMTAEWTMDEYAPAEWTKAKGNLLAGLAPSESSGVSPYASKDVASLSDRKVPSTSVNSTVVGFQNNGTIAWTFDGPKTLEGIRISSLWEGKTYNGISIAAVQVKYSVDGEWEALNVPTIEWTGGTKDGQIATLADIEVGYLAQDVFALKLTFGQQKAAVANYYAEIEAIGPFAAIGPSFGAVTVEPDKTTAKISGVIEELGTDATACDVYLTLGTDAPILIAEDVTDAFEYVISGLEFNTTYFYELTAVNDAPSAKSVVKSGSFTTLREKEQTAKWDVTDYVPGEWTVARGNLLANLTPIESYLVSPYAGTDLTKLTDGVVPTDAIDATVVGFQPGGTIAWAFDEPKTLVGLRISSLWKGMTYNGISIDAVEVAYFDTPDVWVALDVPTIAWTGGSKDGQCAILSDTRTGALADNVVKLRLTFGAQKAAIANYYAEIEAMGYASTDVAIEPTLNEPTVETPTSARAIVSDSFLSIGQKALYATLTFAWGTDPATLGEPELLTDNAFAGVVYSKTLTGLTPGATYYYVFTARNDAVEKNVLKSGSFKMPELSRVDCSLDILDGVVSVVAGGTTYTSSSKISIVQGDEITFRAIPAEGYVFERWVGELVEPALASANPLTIAMLTACSVRPVVRPVSESVTVTWNGGEGAWDNATQWDKGFVPTAADVVVIPSGTCTAVEQVSVAALSLLGDAKLIVAEPNSGHYGNLAVAGDLVLGDEAKLHVAAGPLIGEQYTLATGSGFVTVGGTFEIKDTAKFVPCCDQYTGGGVVTKAGDFVLASGASVEAISLGYKRFPDRDPASQAPGAGTDYGHGASYGGYGDTWQGRGAGIAPYGFANAPVHPGSHKYDSSHTDDLTAGGGNVRIHAGRVTLAGTVDVSANVAPAQGASAGGGIWITAADALKVKSTAKLLAQGAMTANEGFAHGNGAGGRIALGLRLKDEEIASLAEIGALPEGSDATIDADLEKFLSSHEGVMINLAGGAPESVEDLPAIADSYGTFRFVKGIPSGMILMVR